MKKLLLFALLLSITQTVDVTEVIVPDSPNPSLPNIAFVVIPGAMISSSQYIEFFKTVKKQSASKLNVYTCILWYFASIPQPVDIEHRIQYGLSDLKKKGLPENYRLFIGGHSLGSVFAQTDYLYTDLKPEGLVFLNGYMLRKYWYGKEKLDFPVKSLTLGGEKDGQSPITRLTETWYNTAKNTNVDQHVTVILEGANHMSLTTGSVPSFVKQYDLKADIDSGVAKSQAAEVLTAYWSNDTTTMKKYTDRTNTQVEPIVWAFENEKSRLFNGPNQYGGPGESTCIKGGCSDTNHLGAQITEMVAGDLNGYTIDFTNHYAYLPGDPLFSFGKYDFHLPTVTQDHEKKTGTITSFSQCYFDGIIDEIFHSFDVALAPISAAEIATKIRSRQCVQNELHQVKDIPFSVDDPQFCKEFNQKIIDDVLTHASPAALARYKKYAKQYVAGDDKATGSGPGFLSGHISFEDDGTQILVKSPLLKTDINYWIDTFHFPRPSFIPDPGCYHYCKILSPARVMEYLYVGGLRGKESSEFKGGKISVLEG